MESERREKENQRSTEVKLRILQRARLIQFGIWNCGLRNEKSEERRAKYEVRRAESGSCFFWPPASYRSPLPSCLLPLISLLLIAWLTAARVGYAQGDWFDRMAVPIVQGTDFASMCDASLRAVGLYPVGEFMLGPWYAIGPYPRDGSSSVPLQNIDITTKIKTLAGPANWQAVKGWDNTTQPLDLAALFPTKENVSAYLYRSIQAPNQASVLLRISADDDCTVWLNGKEVISRTEDGSNAEYDKNRKRLTLQKGENELVIRVGQASGPWRLFFGLEPQIDTRVRAKILAEALKAFPSSPESYAGRVELARQFLELGDRDRALEQANAVLLDSAAPAESRAGAEQIVKRFVDITITTKQSWNLFTPEELTSQSLPVDLSIMNRTSATLTGELVVTVSDVSGQTVAQIPPLAYNLVPKASLSRTVSFRPPAWGAYLVAAQTPLGKVLLRSETVVGFIPKPRTGLRPESFFAATTEGEGNFAAWAKIGIKVTRDFFCNYQWAFKEIPNSTAAAIQTDFSRLDKAVADRKQHGLSILPVAGDARPFESSLAKRMKASGPPYDMIHFTSVTARILQHLPDVKYCDFWGDPWIFGPTWVGAAANYRYSLKMWARGVKQVRPDIKVLAGGRPSFFVDNILPDPNTVKVLDGLTNCPRYASSAANWRSGAQLRFMDFSVQEAKRQGMELSFVTDSGTDRSRGQSGLLEDRQLDGAQMAKFYVLAALSGNFQASIHQNAGWGDDYPVGNVAYAIMTQMLEDRPVVADIWPAHPLIWGAIFAHPRWITDEVKALPRAKDLLARWNVAVPKERENDATKVAVIWTETGLDAEHLDSTGTLTVQPAGDLRALDMVGRPVGQKNGDALTVPFSQYPVYLLSDQMSVVEMHRRIAAGRIEGLTPVNSYLLSLPSPLGATPTTLTARVQNQLNRPLKGTITLTGPKDWKIEPAQRPFELKPAELAEVDFRATATSTTALNQYVVRTKIESDGGRYERSEIVAVACIRSLTAKVDGDLNEWTTATFARVDNEQIRDLGRYIQWLSDPSQPRPQPPAGQAFLGAKVAVGYDANNVYIAVVVHEPGLGNATDGRPASYDENPLLNGDCLEFAFGFGDRAPDNYRPPDDPWYWKGMFRDVDYALMEFRNRGDATILQSLYVPGLTWRTDYQTEPVNVFLITGGQARFIRDEVLRTTAWEIAVPRKYLNRFDPTKPYCRFGFVYYNDEKLPPLEWARACGVFDYWTNFGSFLPAWNALLACQTRWGISR